MTTVIVLFNLKDSTAVPEYERWAREVDLPVAGALPSVERFQVLRTTGLFGGGIAPYQYVEILKIRDMDRFGTDVSSAQMQKVAEQFQAFADHPQFMITESL